ncbi:hypothetical protein P152DRAFT_500692 [Eremomyces bilateralis CBS 781.70]|uniref:Uncharacterized protein n=1 Tax=Eremomyces bilateralis CBS 781.70 TaxID=1392243 RepID=A0A6G1FQK2_9PEZI|nr:uncharacterized protein P152DRAFT_500692 [Eremomyces bilateralis CBS 781.70]KAF1807932.1 hypothetical protein P152DRAFT_500692 [Eremomyces bilateralis CBS 781.70]
MSDRTSRRSVRLNPTPLESREQPRTAALTAGVHRKRARSRVWTSEKRVSDICKYMSKTHHLTLAEFIRVYVTTQGDDGYGDRPATRAKRLADAIYTQPEVLEAIRQHPASSVGGIVTVKALRKEMKALEEAGGMFSAYQVDREQEKSLQGGIRREGQSEDGQKPEDYECILDDMRFGRMYEQVHTHAPLLCGLLDGLMAPKIERKDRPPRDPSKFKHRTAIITSILCYSRASEGSNKFPRVFGAFLHSNGVKRRVLDLLHHFGLCEGYKGVHKHLKTVAEQAKASPPSLGMDFD